MYKLEFKGDEVWITQGPMTMILDKSHPKLNNVIRKSLDNYLKKEDENGKERGALRLLRATK